MTSGSIAATVPALFSRARRIACFFALITFLSAIDGTVLLKMNGCIGILLNVI
ncbi:hypothetical protein C426_0254 [Lactococcus garvieae DCC43]|uniref:Uncharacterized protein n=1 Tax=Lactococcus garvieae DCC43 TaxID=1231377 RepID=K2QFT0_9LACT|nr:hypothetical protein C426_0254 [Lactococcus garvieae DCC43]